LKTIKIIFGRSYLPISVGIQIRTWSKWSHVGALDGENEDIVLEARGGVGVVETPLKDFIARYREVEIREIHCPNDNVLHDIRQRLGAKYDDKAFWGIALGLLGWDDINAYQCVELIGKYSGIFDRELCNSLVPKDIRKVSHDISRVFNNRPRRPSGSTETS
jgi:hypothetical protein